MTEAGTSRGLPVAVVTGANRGLGAAIAKALAGGGFAVAVSARSIESAQATVDLIEADGGTAKAFEADVADETSVQSFAADVQHWGAVHTVVANAGIAGPTAPMHELSLDQWRETIVTDLDSVFLTFREFIPELIERRAGSLIAISSISGKRPLHSRTPYTAAKMGIIGLVRSLATELGPHGIRVNSVCPGGISGDRIDEVIRLQAETQGVSREEAEAIFTDPSPMKRLVTAEEVAASCAFLASDQASSITGEDLNVSAGVVMY